MNRTLLFFSLACLILPIKIIAYGIDEVPPFDDLPTLAPPIEEYVNEGSRPVTGRMIPAIAPIVEERDLDYLTGHVPSPHERQCNTSTTSDTFTDRTDGRSYVVHASTDTSASRPEPSYCASAAEWEKQICTKAIASNTARATGAASRLSSNSNHYHFTQKEKEMTNHILNEVLRSVNRTLAQSNLSGPLKEKIRKKISTIKVSSLSFTENANTITNSSDRRKFQNWCSSKSTDNAYYSDSHGDLVICPGHLAKAFAGAPDHGHPEEILALNIAHELTHSIDFNNMPGAHYNNLITCYNTSHGQSSTRGFGNQSDSLCCCPSRSSSPRSCTSRTHCPFSCNVDPYMGEVVGDNWANDVVGDFAGKWKITEYQQGGLVESVFDPVLKRHVMREKLILVGQRGLTQSEKFEMVARNLYWYCIAGLDNNGRLKNTSSHDFVHPSHRFRLMEARRNPRIASALGCRVDNRTLQNRSLGKSCWDSSRSNFVSRP